MQSRNKPLADLSNLVANAVGAAKGVGDELKAMSRSQAERFIADMDLVTREEFDAKYEYWKERPRDMSLIYEEVLERLQKLDGELRDGHE